jgi:type IV pilus assembly protein PilM
MALYNAARYSGADAEGCTLLLDIGARSTDLVFLEQGRVFIRSIPVAGNTITQNIMRELEVSFHEAEDLKLEHAFVGLGGAYDAHEDEIKDRVSKVVRNVMTRMHAEINRSINFYRGQQNGSKPQQLLLAGGSAIIPGTDAFFKEKLKIPVHYFNPFENVPVGPEVDAEEVSQRFNVMGQTVGLALRRILTCPIEINLMPARILANKEMRRRRPVFVLAGIGLVLTLLVWCGFFYKMAQLAEERYEIVNRRVTSLSRVQGQIRSVQADLQDVQGKTETIQDLFPARSRWNRILTEIRRHVPEGVWLVSLTPAVQPGMAGVGRSAMPGMDQFFPQTTATTTTGTAAAATDELQRIEISGFGYLDKVENWGPVRDFRDALKASPYFSDKTEITWFPPPSEVTREFKIEVVLAEPLDL